MFPYYTIHNMLNVVAKMHLMILFSLSVHLCDAVIIRIKPVQIVSYRKNYTQTSQTISWTEAKGTTPKISALSVVANTLNTGPTTMREITAQTTAKKGEQPIIPDSVATTLVAKSTGVQAAATGIRTTTALPPVASNPPKVTPSQTSATQTVKVTPVDQPNNSESVKTATATPKSTIITQAPIVPAKKLTDRAGFFRISPHTRLFYWFFRSKSNPTDPVVVWLQGQPNTSSMYGAFDETGPYFIDPQTKRIVARKHSWTNSFNLLYLDPYPGCGFSHSNNPSEYSLSYEQVTKGILRALQQFFAIYPQLMANSLYLAAQSLGAKYAIVVAHAIMQTVHRYKLNLKGVVLGSAVIDEYQLANYDCGIFTFGLIDLKTMDEISQQQDYMAALIRTEAYSRAAEYWHEHIFKFFTRAGYQSPYDVRVVNAFWDSTVANYMNHVNVRKELKMGALKFQPAAKVYFTGETLRPLQTLIRELLSNIKVLLYHGQFDMFAPITHSIEFLNKFNWPENIDFYISKRTNWYIEKYLAGYWSNYQNLTMLLIRNAGHMVGNTQPKSMLQMLKDFTSGKFETSYNFEISNWTHSVDTVND